jgi:hypothetical protein
MLTGVICDSGFYAAALLRRNTAPASVYHVPQPSTYDGHEQNPMVVDYRIEPQDEDYDFSYRHSPRMIQVSKWMVESQDLNMRTEALNL